MVYIRFPRNNFTPESEDTFFLDTSFIVRGLANDRHCGTVFAAISENKKFVSVLVNAEVLHVLAMSYFADDFKKLILGQKGFLHRNTIYNLRRNLMSEYQGLVKDGINYRSLKKRILKVNNPEVKKLLIPYQKTAISVLTRFLNDNEIEVLDIECSLYKDACKLLSCAPIDTYDAYHLAAAQAANCSHLVTADEDFRYLTSLVTSHVLHIAS